MWHLMVGNMIEAVNSVLSNAPYTKAAAEQQSVVKSFAANPARIQEAVSAAPYISLYIKVDTNFDKAVLQIRDSDTGDVVRQIPTESELEAYRRSQTANSVRPATVEDPVYVPEAPEQDSAPAQRSAPSNTSGFESSSVTSAVTTPAPATSAPVSVNTQA